MKPPFVINLPALFFSKIAVVVFFQSWEVTGIGNFSAVHSLGELINWFLQERAIGEMPLRAALRGPVSVTVLRRCELPGVDGSSSLAVKAPVDSLPSSVPSFCTSLHMRGQRLRKTWW